jgi:mRNA-degrading endonuclease HigB of HigAB toxin-antitoxin module
MKLSFGILCLIAAASAVEINIIYPSDLFNDAQKYQNYTNFMQTEMFELITELRLALSATLKKTATSSLSFIEADVRTVFNIDGPYRTLLFDTNNQSTTCLNNMRNRLNYITEFTGFKAGICLFTYDRAVNKVVNETFSQLAIYDDEISAFELSVIEAFAAKNVWTQPEDIRTKFVNSFNRFQTIYDDFKEKIAGFSSNIEEKVKEFADVLNACYKVSQDDLIQQLVVLDADIKTCLIFDNLD